MPRCLHEFRGPGFNLTLSLGNLISKSQGFLGLRILPGSNCLYGKQEQEGSSGGAQGGCRHVLGRDADSVQVSQVWRGRTHRPESSSAPVWRPTVQEEPSRKKRSHRFAQSLSRVRLFATPRTAACQASLAITSSRSSPKLMSISLMMPSNHLILCRPLLLLPSFFPIIKVFSHVGSSH